MGGNLLGGRRISPSTAKSIIHELTKEFKAKGINLFTIPWVEEKPDLGDIDLLCSAPISSVRLAVCREYKENAGVFSFLHDGVQIDIIVVKDIRAAIFYFGYNDFGGLFGVIARQNGLKFGPTGLYWTHRIPGFESYKEDVFITSDPMQIFLFLGKNWEDVRFGVPRFKTFSEMFGFIASSSLFDPVYFLAENRNANDRNRDKKRPTFLKFKEYCLKFRTNSLTDKEERKKRMLETIREKFPEFGVKLDKLTHKQIIERDFRKSFTSEMICSVLNIAPGKELGTIKNEMCDYIRSNSLEQYVSNQSQDEVKELILKLHNKEFTRPHIFSCCWDDPVKGSRVMRYFNKTKKMKKTIDYMLFNEYNDCCFLYVCFNKNC